MTLYLVAIQHAVDYDPSMEDDAMGADISALNDQMVAAGIRVFVGGLGPPNAARSLRPTIEGEVLITDGPYAEAKELVGGFWVLNVATLEEALDWGRRAVMACRAPVEVRPFN